MEKIKNELGEKGGAGHVFGKDNRNSFNEEKVRRILRGLEAGLTEVNFLKRIRIAFYYFLFYSFRRDFHPNKSFIILKTWKCEKPAGTCDNKRTSQNTAETDFGKFG